MDGSDNEGQPQGQKDNEDQANQPSNPGRRTFLTNIAKGAGALAGASVVGTSSTGPDANKNSDQKAGDSDSQPIDGSNASDAVLAAEGMGLAALAVKGPSVLNRKFSRAQALVGTAKIAGALAAGPVLKKIGDNRREGDDNSDPVQVEEVEKPVTPPLTQYKRGTLTLEQLGVEVIDERNKGAISESVKKEPLVERIRYQDAFEEMNPYLEKSSPKDADKLRNTIKSYQVRQVKGGPPAIGTLEQYPSMGALLEKKVVDEGIVIKFDDLLKKEAEKNKLNADIVKGIIFIESLGDPNAISYAGAVGISQFMPDTGALYGLVEFDDEGNITVDRRTDPVESVKAMCEYLGYLRNLFGGNMGLATWAYHAGEGNVMTALQLYFRDKLNVEIGDYGESPSGVQLGISAHARLLIEKDRLNVFRLLNHSSVVSFVENGIPEEGKRKLENDTRNYATKAIAGAQYYENS